MAGGGEKGADSGNTDELVIGGKWGASKIGVSWGMPGLRLVPCDGKEEKTWSGPRMATSGKGNS